ncbi:MAG: DUF4124 domain-containing protein [Methylophilus sp.]
MSIKYLWIILLSLTTFLSVNVNAEVYKWTDKDGVVRYTDVPPPSYVKKYTTIGNKKTKEVTKDVAKEPVVEPKTEPKDAGVAAGSAKAKLTESQQSKKDVANDVALDKRRQQADIEKQNKEKKEAEAKQKQENCTAARSNYQTYSQGGRVYQMNEKGEREFVSDQGLADKAAQAQRDMQQYCN